MRGWLHEISWGDVFKLAVIFFLLYGFVSCSANDIARSYAKARITIKEKK